MSSWPAPEIGWKCDEGHPGPRPAGALRAQNRHRR
jgi:hypothetical protein